MTIAMISPGMIRFGSQTLPQKNKVALEALFAQHDSALKQNGINRVTVVALTKSVGIVIRGRFDYDMVKVQEMKAFLKDKAGATDHPTDAGRLLYQGTDLIVEPEILHKPC